MMDDKRFDAWARLLGSPAARRAVARVTVAGGLGAALAMLGVGGAVACGKPGKECKKGVPCCSGVCRKKKCRRVAGHCTLARNFCQTGSAVAACDVLGIASCLCTRRLNGAAFCANTADMECFDCADDAACAEEFGAGFVCIQGGGPGCGCQGGLVNRCGVACPIPA